jgi:hypothetical protein
LRFFLRVTKIFDRFRIHQDFSFAILALFSILALKRFFFQTTIMQIFGSGNLKRMGKKEHSPLIKSANQGFF